MATEETNKDAFSDFSIKDTMEMGMGNAQLLNDLMSPETSTDPADITPIVKDAEPPAPPADPKTLPLKGKDLTPPEPGEEPKNKNTINDFLGNHEDDDEEEVITTGKTADITKDNEEDAPQGNQFTALSRDLFKLGVFTQDEDESESDISTPEAFLERFNNEKQKGAIDMVNQFIGQFGEDYQQAFDAIYVKGVDPREYFTAYNTAVDYAEMDLTIESNQESVMRTSLTEQGYDKEDIDTEIERLKNYGDLETVATRNHKVLVKKQAAKLQEIEQRSQYELAQKAQVKNLFINNVQSVIQEKLKEKQFDGIPINTKLASELQEFLLVDKYKTAAGDTLTDFDKMILDLKKPENHATKVKIALLLKVLEKDPTLSTIQKAGVTKQTDSLFSEVARQVTKDRTTGGSKNTGSLSPPEWGGL